jgi:hypothetical protein
MIETHLIEQIQDRRQHYVPCLAGERRDIGAGTGPKEDRRLGEVEAGVMSAELNLRERAETRRSARMRAAWEFSWNYFFSIFAGSCSAVQMQAEPIYHYS